MHFQIGCTRGKRLTPSVLGARLRIVFLQEGQLAFTCSLSMSVSIGRPVNIQLGQRSGAATESQCSVVSPKLVSPK